MENMINGKSMKWYNACKVITLVLGILGCLKLIGSVCMLIATIDRMSWWLYTSVMVSSKSSLAEIYISLIHTTILEIVILTVFVVMLFVAYNGIKKYRKSVFYIMLTFNVILPIVCVLMIPVINEHMNLYIMDIANSIDAKSVFFDISKAIKYKNIAVPTVMILSALITGGALIPNTIYFKRRKDLLE